MRRAFISIALYLTVAACGGGTALEGPELGAATPAPTSSSTSTSTTTTVPPTTTTTVAPPLVAEDLPDGETLVVKSQAEVDVFLERGDDEPFVTLDATTIVGTPTVLAVMEGPHDGWARVMLPIRPNGSEGWVEVDGMKAFVVDGHIVVDLSELTLTYYEQGKTVLTTPVAVGTSSNQTPTGSFFVTDNVTLANPSSPWGPHALGLSARSDSITEYNGGDGIIGIHGTNRPGSIGNPVSLGCVRVPNDVITRLHRMVTIGTPVQINA
jgi:lipoprotein-anchoring transpeptidase ErfK/SrfK